MLIKMDHGSTIVGFVLICIPLIFICFFTFPIYQMFYCNSLIPLKNTFHCCNSTLVCVFVSQIFSYAKCIISIKFHLLCQTSFIYKREIKLHTGLVLHIRIWRVYIHKDFFLDRIGLKLVFILPGFWGLNWWCVVSRCVTSH